MDKRQHIPVKALLVLAATAAIGWLAPPWSGAQMIAPEQGTPSEQQKSMSLTEGGTVIPTDEPAAKEFDQGVERPLKAPATTMDGDVSGLLLRTPDQHDVENARESDERSSVSF